MQPKNLSVLVDTVLSVADKALSYLISAHRPADAYVLAKSVGDWAKRKQEAARLYLLSMKQDRIKSGEIEITVSGRTSRALTLKELRPVLEKYDIEESKILDQEVIFHVSPTKLEDLVARGFIPLIEIENLYQENETKTVRVSKKSEELRAVEEERIKKGASLEAPEQLEGDD